NRRKSCACGEDGGCARIGDYPSRPVRLIVPFSPRGGADTRSNRARANHRHRQSQLSERQVRAGKLGAPAVADKKCSAILPGVPTAAETGIAGPLEFGQVLREEIAKWAATIKRAEITPD